MIITDNLLRCKCTTQASVTAIGATNHLSGCLAHRQPASCLPMAPSITLEGHKFPALKIMPIADMRLLSVPHPHAKKSL